MPDKQSPSGRGLLVVGSDNQRLDELTTMLRDQSDLNVAYRVKLNGQSDPLREIDQMPAVMLLDLSEDWRQELGALAALPGNRRPPMIAIGPPGDQELMRMAMKVGARDYFTYPAPPEELARALRELLRDSDHQIGQVIAVINAKGGSGASFISVHLGYAMAANLHLRGGLVDMDLQFGDLPMYFDVKPRACLVEALMRAERLDALVLDAYATRHASGLDLFCARNADLTEITSLEQDAIDRFLELAADNYQYVIVDLPRQIDVAAASTLTRADVIILVVQESLPHLRDARRMLQLLVNELGVPRKRIELLVNRHAAKGALSLKDLTEALPDLPVHTLPNDFSNVSEAVNLGVPLFEGSPGAQSARALIDLASEFTGVKTHTRGRIRRAISSIFRG